MGDSDLRITANVKAEVLVDRSMDRHIQQPEIDAHGTSLIAGAAAHTTASQVEGARDVPGEVAHRCRVKYR